MSRPDRSQPPPTVRRPSHSQTPAGSGHGRAHRLVRDGISLGLLVAGVGVLFVGVFTLSDLVWGSYFGADPSVGQALSFAVMTIGIAIATLLWVAREIGVAARRGATRARSSR